MKGESLEQVAGQSQIRIIDCVASIYIVPDLLDGRYRDQSDPFADVSVWPKLYPGSHSLVCLQKEENYLVGASQQLYGYGRVLVDRVGGWLVLPVCAGAPNLSGSVQKDAVVWDIARQGASADYVCASSVHPDERCGSNQHENPDHPRSIFGRSALFVIWLRPCVLFGVRKKLRKAPESTVRPNLRLL